MLLLCYHAVVYRVLLHGLAAACGRHNRVVHLRCKPSWVVGQQRVDRGASTGGLHHTTQIEVGDLHSPVALHQHVGGFQIPVQDGWLVGM